MRRIMHVVREQFPLLALMGAAMVLLSPSTAGQAVGVITVTLVLGITLVEIWRENHPRP